LVAAAPVAPPAPAEPPTESPSSEPDLSRLEAQLTALLALVGRRPDQLEEFRHAGRPAAATPELTTIAAPTMADASSVETSVPTAEVTAVPLGETAVPASAATLTSLAQDLDALEVDRPIVVPIARGPVAEPPPLPEPKPVPAPPPVRTPDPAVEARPASVPIPTPSVAAKSPSSRKRRREKRAAARRAEAQPRPAPPTSGPWVAAAAVFGVIGAAAFGATHLARWQGAWMAAEAPPPDAVADPGDAEPAPVESAASGTPASSPAVPPGPPAVVPGPAPRNEEPARAVRPRLSESVARPASSLPSSPDVPAQPAPAPPQAAEPQTLEPPTTEPSREPPVAEEESAQPPAGEDDAADEVEDRIHQAIALYMRAYTNLDPSGIRKVWPGADVQALARAFEPMKAVRIGIDRCDLDVAVETATASCPGRAMYLLKEGGPEPQAEMHHWTFRLRRAGDGWIIEDVEVQ
jgi:hypothetical protein